MQLIPSHHLHVDHFDKHVMELCRHMKKANNLRRLILFELFAFFALRFVITVSIDGMFSACWSSLRRWLYMSEIANALMYNGASNNNNNKKLVRFFLFLFSRFQALIVCANTIIHSHSVGSIFLSLCASFLFYLIFVSCCFKSTAPANTHTHTHTRARASMAWRNFCFVKKKTSYAGVFYRAARFS